MPPLPIEVVSYKSRLERAIKLAEPIDDAELQAHLARHICVLCSGFLEVAVVSVLSQYVSNKSAPQVATYVKASLSQFQNPKMSKILELVGKFDSDWRRDLTVLFEGELKDSVDSIVANRHAIAHGRQTTVTLQNLKSYYRNASTVIDYLASHCEVN
ncbi:HEPN domain-containing protein [Actinopolymorpha sp. NPDC004070]|uniref:HEPN domain-containing protein n=1 Tax=Actinopolymorpha sp. NPDC004070 TaxID=3154548 RepID=UPI0033B994DE